MNRLVAVLSALAVGAVLVLGLATGVVAGSPVPPPPPGPVHPHRSPSPAEQEHATGGPFVSLDQAVQLATAVGVGPGVPFSSELLTVHQASSELGFRAVSTFVGDDREVFLIKVKGPYKPAFWFGGQPPILDRYYVVIDAPTGRILATGELRGP